MERDRLGWARHWVWLALGTAVIAACSSAAKPGGTASVPTAPPTTADPWAVPAVITVPYVNRVLAELNHIDGNAIRSARAANAITPQFIQLEQSIRATSQDMQLVTEAWTKTMDSGWTSISTNPGDRVSTVIDLMSANTTCIYASVHEDLSPEGPGGVGSPPRWWIALHPEPPSSPNPTHWAYIYDGYDSSGGAPQQPCNGY